MNFADIELSRKEKRILRKLQKDDILLTDFNKSVIGRLEHLEFCKIVKFDCPQKGNPRVARLTYLGLDYLKYNKNQAMNQKHHGFAWLLTTIIAIVGLIISIIEFVIDFAG